MGSTGSVQFSEVSKRYWLGRGPWHRDAFWALKKVSFDVKPGETLGIVGPNGAGKTTILKLLARVTTPTMGEVLSSGRLIPLIELNAGFHTDLTGRENIYLNGSILGISKREIDKKFDAIVSFSELESFIDQPLKSYSFGMFMRLGFSVAAHSDPEVLLIDEVLAVGDRNFRDKCLERIREFQKSKVTIILVTHETSFLNSLCERVLFLQGGQVKALGSPSEVLSLYPGK